MRYIFWVFFIVSLLLHLFMLDILHLPQEDKTREKPIDIQIVPKEKPLEKPKEKSKPKPEPKPVPVPEKPKVEPVPEKKPQTKPEPKREYKRNIPLDEEKETDVRQMTPVPPQKGQKAPLKNGQSNKEMPDKTPSSRTQPTGQPKSQGDVPGGRQDVDKPTVSPGSPKIGMPDGTSKDKIDLTPKDIIDKYATGGSDVTGEDTVSMQYVKMRYQSYFFKFASRLYRVWTYPPEAGARGEGGIVQASFIISRDGSISSIRIIRSSGYPDLDNEVITALRKMSGVPLPDSYKLDNLKVDAFFHYINGNRFRVY